MAIQKTLRNVKISDIWLDYDLYPRQKTIHTRVDDLQQVLEQKGKFKEPIVVAQIQGRDGYGLVDGAHRREVYLRKGIRNVEVEYLGLLTKKDFMKEACERNNSGPMQLSATDKRLAAYKMSKLGMSSDEIYTLTGYTGAVLKSLNEIVYKDTEDRPAHIPQALTKKDPQSGIIHLKAGITQSAIQKHADVVEKIPRHFAPKAAIRHLNTLLEYNWLDIVNDDEGRRLATKLYHKIGEVLSNDGGR